MPSFASQSGCRAVLSPAVPLLPSSRSLMPWVRVPSPQVGRGLRRARCGERGAGSRGRGLRVGWLRREEFSLLPELLSCPGAVHFGGFAPLPLSPQPTGCSWPDPIAARPWDGRASPERFRPAARSRALGAVLGDAELLVRPSLAWLNPKCTPELETGGGLGPVFCSSPENTVPKVPSSPQEAPVGAGVCWHLVMGKGCLAGCKDEKLQHQVSLC